MRALSLIVLITFLMSCNSENNESSNKLSDFIKANYSHNQSFVNCQLQLDKNLNSVERFIPLFVDDLKKVLDSEDEIFFLFPMQNKNMSISKFEIVLNHKDEIMINEMFRILEELSFADTATCKNQDLLYGRLKLKSSSSISNLSVIEVMECEYLDGFNYATMKLVFEEFIDILAKIDHDLSIIYSENTSDTSSFRWFNIFDSIESRKIFIESWQDLSVSNQMQTLFTEQSSCGDSTLYKSYKVI
jgi:hypothetical protein